MSSEILLNLKFCRIVYCVKDPRPTGYWWEQSPFQRWRQCAGNWSGSWVALLWNLYRVVLDGELEVGPADSSRCEPAGVLEVAAVGSAAAASAGKSPENSAQPMS